jgi:multidrug efflux pump subunit AcrA (membrane-fusion protein)
MIENNAGVQVYPLISPIDGTVIDRDIGEGQSVTENDELFTIGDNSVLQARFFVGNQDMPKLKIGQDVVLLADRRPPVKSKIEFVSQILEPGARTGVVLASTDDKNLRPGLHVSGAAVMSSKEVEFCLPRSLFSYDQTNLDSEQMVYVKAGDAIELKKIKIGQSDLLNTQVSSGLTPNDELVGAPIAKVDALVAAAQDPSEKSEPGHEHGEEEKNEEKHEDNDSKQEAEHKHKDGENKEEHDEHKE